MAKKKSSITMNWDLFSSITFTLALLGLYFAFVSIPEAVELGAISTTTATWLRPLIVGLSLGDIGSTLYRFFMNVSDIKMALQNISRTGGTTSGARGTFFP